MAKTKECAAKRNGTTAARKAVRLILVGGFLGAGKTTLLWEAAKRLVRRGKRVGLITNDQAPDLVDTAWLKRVGVGVQEVWGSCFCCNFPALIAASRNLIRDSDAEIVIAEPVGSCTDLSATILQPLKDKFAGEFVLSPFTVLVDPGRLQEVLRGSALDGLHPSAAYIFGKQLDEADLIVVNKADVLSPPELEEVLGLVKSRFSGAPVHRMSAADGTGVEDWLDTVMGDVPAGGRMAEVDYDTYAEGEAALGWLNALVQVSVRQSVDWKVLCQDLMEDLQHALQQKKAAIAHLKILLSMPDGFIVANLTSNQGPVSIRGGIGVSAGNALLHINARAQISPQELEEVVRDSVQRMATETTQVEIKHLQSLSPGRPRPTHRYGKVV